MDRDNQQQTVKDVELAWLAGLIEGEGSIQLTVPQSKGGRQHRVMNLWVDLSNTDAALINRAIDILDRLGIRHYDGQKFIQPVYKQDGTCYKSDKIVCLFVRTCKLASTHALLTALHPFFVGQKKHIAEIALRFATRRLSRGRRPYEEQDMVIAQEFFRTRGGKFGTRNVELLDRMLRDYTPSDVEKASMI